MRFQLLGVVAIIGLASGCAEFRKGQRGAADSDHNVMTGGPVRGTRINQLPPIVRLTLAEEAPDAEVADIVPTSQDGRLVYRITFSEPEKNAPLLIEDDGVIVQECRDMYSKYKTAPVPQQGVVPNRSFQPIP
jgi:hypothetical protein